MPLTFQAAHDAFAIYLTPGFAAGFGSTMVNKASGLCSDENDWTTVSAAQLQQHTCHSGTKQRFTFAPTSSGAALVQVSCTSASTRTWMIAG